MSPTRTIGAPTRRSSRMSSPSSTPSRSGSSDGQRRAMSRAEPIIRPSGDDDVAAIAAIYGRHVLHGVASFEEVPPPAEEIGSRRAAILAHGLPYLVAERDGRVVGYCY